MKIAALSFMIMMTPALAGTLEYAAPARMPPLTIPWEIVVVPPDELGAACGLDPERLVGCSLLWPGERCKIILPAGLDVPQEAEIIQHELAHCGGWTHKD